MGPAEQRCGPDPHKARVPQQECRLRPPQGQHEKAGNLSICGPGRPNALRIQRRPPNRHSREGGHLRIGKHLQQGVSGLIEHRPHIRSPDAGVGIRFDQERAEIQVGLRGMTDIDQRELRLLDYPASKQFLISVIGELREEIAGKKVSEPKALELKQEFITVDGKEAISAWVKVLKSILPIMVQSLPAEEYQVVRSTEHTQAVAKTTKGVVAGLQIMQSSFDDIRKLLKPVQH